jgi:hypothetical protein
LTFDDDNEIVHCDNVVQRAGNVRHRGSRERSRSRSSSMNYPTPFACKTTSRNIDVIRNNSNNGVCRGRRNSCQTETINPRVVSDFELQFRDRRFSCIVHVMIGNDIPIPKFHRYEQKRCCQQKSFCREQRTMLRTLNIDDNVEPT